MKRLLACVALSSLMGLGACTSVRVTRQGQPAQRIAHPTPRVYVVHEHGARGPKVVIERTGDDTPEVTRDPRRGPPDHAPAHAYRRKHRETTDHPGDHRGDHPGKAKGHDKDVICSFAYWTMPLG